MLHYDCQAGMVITNSSFTTSANQLAAKDRRLTLYDRHWLEAQIIKHFPPQIPEFDWDEYHRLSKNSYPG